MNQRQASEPSTGEKPSFEAALAMLEVIVRELEDGQIGLAEGLSRYEQGVTLLRQCSQMLEHAERRIELLSRVDADGNSTTEPFDDQTSSLEEKAQAPRSRRRKRASTADVNHLQNEGEMDGPGQLF